ncbi:CDGSH iron-sulfur domain-containing protein [Haloferacaceae archaeon DSL9]
MARDVTHTETKPLFLGEDDIDPERGDIAICRCGLSETRPFCDGRHRLTEDEADGVRYVYDGDGRRAIDRIVFEDEA